MALPGKIYGSALGGAFLPDLRFGVPLEPMSPGFWGRKGSKFRHIKPLGNLGMLTVHIDETRQTLVDGIPHLFQFAFPSG